jgi:NAD(P)-dependent dehydrogenase (short-subunit alcohol dehydrogenase family)
VARLAVVTGGSGGIGFACGEQLVAQGYDVVLTSRRPEPLAEAAQRIGARWVAADAADEQSFAQVLQDLDRVDLLVHAAGVLDGTFVRKESPETFDRVIRINLRSTYVVTAAVLPKMTAGGRIVFISSSAATHGMKGRSAYSASKAGMNAFAEALRDEVARDGIHVNVVTPAPVQTEMLQRVTFPMHTLQSTDVARAVLFLDQLDPGVVVPEIAMEAVSEGPLAPPPVLPEAYLAKTTEQPA